MRTFATHNILSTNLRNSMAMVLILILAFGCKKEYQTITGSSSGYFIVNANLVKNQDTQKVELRRAIGNSYKKYPYVSNCYVYIEDELGNTFPFTESKTETDSGTYLASINDADLVIDRKYRLHIETPEGKTYQSDYETINKCPPIDTVYCESENVYSTDNSTYSPSAQFYIDLIADKDYTKYYRWTMEEDWSYKTPYPWNGYYNGDSVYFYHSYNNNYNMNVCYDHGNVNGLYCASTENLTINEKKKIPLHSVSEETLKLSLRYSLYISQYSLTEEAYFFWERQQEIMGQSGSLYTTQPSLNLSNMHNIDDADENVLGFFWATEKIRKRFFFTLIPDNYNYFEFCELEPFNFDSLEMYEELPVYFTYMIWKDHPWQTADYECFDCREHGDGDTAKPDFWMD